MRLLSVMLLAGSVFAIATDAIAQTRREAKWCLHAAGVRSCVFATFEQCNKNRRSMGGSCQRNPRYVAR